MGGSRNQDPAILLQPDHNKMPLNLLPQNICPNSSPNPLSYAYLASMVAESKAVKWDGVAKIDLTRGEGEGDACVGRIKLPPGHFNGETMFVPRWGAAAFF
jgi:hypothetical protein